MNNRNHRSMGVSLVIFMTELLYMQKREATKPERIHAHQVCAGHITKR